MEKVGQCCVHGYGNECVCERDGVYGEDGDQYSTFYDEYDWTVRTSTVGHTNRTGLRVLCVHGGLDCVFVKTECVNTLCDSGYGQRTCRFK